MVFITTVMYRDCFKIQFTTKNKIFKIFSCSQEIRAETSLKLALHIYLNLIKHSICWENRNFFTVTVTKEWRLFDLFLAWLMIPFSQMS